MKVNNHWLTTAEHIHSPNCDSRSDENDISLIVIHCISLPPGEFDTNYISQLFCNQLNPHEHDYFKQIHQLTVSAHLLIKRSGKLVQYVPFNKRAWHAGISSFKGREKCNDYSIGIELEGTEDIDYTNDQYQTLAKTIKTLLKYYPKLTSKNITGHSDIAPGRKTDPGNSFKWDKLYALLTD